MPRSPPLFAAAPTRSSSSTTSSSSPSSSARRLPRSPSPQASTRATTQRVPPTPTRACPATRSRAALRRSPAAAAPLHSPPRPRALRRRPRCLSWPAPTLGRSPPTQSGRRQARQTGPLVRKGCACGCHGAASCRFLRPAGFRLTKNVANSGGIAVFNVPLYIASGFSMSFDVQARGGAERRRDVPC